VIRGRPDRRWDRWRDRWRDFLAGIQPAQALVPCHRVQPGTEATRITQPVQLDRRDQEGVEHRPGGFRFG
jgi:hypothetical protein